MPEPWADPNSTSMLNNDTLIVDADSHWTEPPDLFTRLAPPEYKDRVPRVEEVDGEPTWVFDGHVARAGQRAAASSAATGRRRAPTSALNHWTIDEIHVGAYDPKVRLEVLDECGIDAQVIFPSTIGLGGQDLGMVEDEALCRLVDRDLQRPDGRDPGRVGQPAPADAAHAGVGHRHLHRRGQAGRGARRARREHDVRPAGPRRARPRQPRVGPVLGDVHRAPAAGALPHRRQRHRDDVLRPVPVGLAPDGHQARHRRHAAVHRQRARRDER